MPATNTKIAGITKT